MVEKPDVVKDEHLIFLDDLRQCGVTNSYGSRKYVEREFGVGKDAAKEIVIYWMQTFKNRHPAAVPHR